MRLSALAGLVSLTLSLNLGGLSAQDGKLDGEGYVRDWVIRPDVQ